MWQAKKFSVLLLVFLLCTFLMANLRFPMPVTKAAVIFQDEFESGNFSAWTGNYADTDCTAEVVPAPVKSGFYSGKFVTAAVASGNKKAYVYKSLSDASYYYARAYVYLDSDALPLDDVDDRFGFIQFLAGSTPLATAQVRHTTDGDFFGFVTYGMSFMGTTAVLPEEGKWYCIEFYLKLGTGTSGEARLWIDGVERAAKTGYDNTNGGQYTVINQVRFGNPYTVNVQHQVTVYADLCAVGDSYIGPVQEQPPQEYIWQDGFETGDFSQWGSTSKTTGETAVVVSSLKHHGTYSAEFSCDGSSTGEQSYAVKTLNQTYATIYVRAYYYITALTPTSGKAFVSSPNLRNSAAGKAVAYVSIYNSGGTCYWRLYYMDGATGKQYVSTVQAVANSWTCVEVYVKVHGTAGEYKLWINGELAVSLTNIDSDE
jgi:hypothetical protein